MIVGNMSEIADASPDGKPAERFGYGTPAFEKFRAALYESGGDLLSAIGAVDPAAADAYRIEAAQQVNKDALSAAASYAPNIAAPQLNALGIHHPLA